MKPDHLKPTVIPVANEELFTVREAMRTLNLIVRQIEEGMIEKAVLMKNGKMVAVVCGLDQYDGA